MAKNNILSRSKLKKVKQLLDHKQIEEADKILTQLMRSAPREVETWLYKGYVEGLRKNHIKAAEYLKKSLDLKPGDPSVLYNYGVAARDSGDLETAAAAFEKSLINDPSNTRTLDCLADVYMGLVLLDKAAETFRRSLSVNAKQPETHSNLGSVYLAQGELSKSEQCFREALSLNPNLNIFDNLGSVLVSQGRYQESIAAYRAGLSRYPKNFRVFSNLLLTLNYTNDVSQEDMSEEHRKFGYVFEDPLNYITHDNNPRDVKELRIGYYSPDFREHSVAYFIEPIIEHHNKAKFKTYAYYPSKFEDAVTKRLKLVFNEWRDVYGMSADEIAHTIKSDGIDIMVDLAGHTSNNCLLAFAKKPAPVQVTYLGYPNTTGLKAIQYRITDNIVDPAGQGRYYTEELCRLPGCFLTYKPDANSPEVSEPPASNNGYVTFGSFNNLSKINDRVIESWCKILKASHGSRLLIKNPSLTDLQTRQVYLDKFIQSGIDGDRISLLGHVPTRSEHLALYANIDVALDTFPYNGTTTTCEALWMGVPVITLKGVNHASRVTTSLLEAIKRPEWTADTVDEYVFLAADMAADIEKLKTYRSNQRQRMSQSSLCDSVSFVSGLESAYEMLWEKHSV